MERKSNQLTVLDNVTRNLGGRRTAAFFAKCGQYIPWEAIAEPLHDMYSNNTSKGSASRWPVVMMIKCMMLQKWFNLSDPAEKQCSSTACRFDGSWGWVWTKAPLTKRCLLSFAGVFASMVTVAHR